MAIDVKIQIESNGTSHIYTLNPGCTITRSISKEVFTYPVELGGKIKLATLGRLEADTIRIDAKCIVNDPGAHDPPLSYTEFPPYVPLHDMCTWLTEQVSTDNLDVIVWGDENIYGRVKSIVVTQRPGEGDLYDFAVTFLVGDYIMPTS